MFINRFASAFPAKPVADPAPAPAAFLLCPWTGMLTGAPMPWQHELYAWALSQAQAVVRPSLPERDLLGVWN